MPEQTPLQPRQITLKDGRVFDISDLNPHDLDLVMNTLKAQGLWEPPTPAGPSPQEDGANWGAMGATSLAALLEMAGLAAKMHPVGRALSLPLAAFTGGMGGAMFQGAETGPAMQLGARQAAMEGVGQFLPFVAPGLKNLGARATSRAIKPSQNILEEISVPGVSRPTQQQQRIQLGREFQEANTGIPALPGTERATQKVRNVIDASTERAKTVVASKPNVKISSEVFLDDFPKQLERFQGRVGDYKPGKAAIDKLTDDLTSNPKFVNQSQQAAIDATEGIERQGSKEVPGLDPAAILASLQGQAKPTFLRLPAPEIQDVISQTYKKINWADPSASLINEAKISSTHGAREAMGDIFGEPYNVEKSLQAQLIPTEKALGQAQTNLAERDPLRWREIIGPAIALGGHQSGFTTPASIAGAAMLAQSPLGMGTMGTGLYKAGQAAASPYAGPTLTNSARLVKMLMENPEVQSRMGSASFLE
jgi:hypothetical protein